jgi:hypothetical protein
VNVRVSATNAGDPVLLPSMPIWIYVEAIDASGANRPLSRENADSISAFTFVLPVRRLLLPTIPVTPKIVTNVE